MAFAPSWWYRAGMRSADQHIFAIGDIHGNREALECLLGRLPVRPQADLLVFMGDYINRGADTCGVLDVLVKVREQYAHTVFLKGNHEHLLLEYAAHADVEMLRTLRGMGIEASLASYGASVRDLQGLAFMPQAHRDFLHSLSLSHSCPPYLFVHADTEEAELSALFAASTQPDPHEAVLVDKVLSSRRLVKEHEVAGSAEAAPLVVFAHAPFEMPLVLPDRICIDTGSVHGNMLTALELPAMRFYHA